MLDNTTKKRIDDCRDILVGKLPDPKAQIEQITIGLIYKFMDDMDKEAIELGGKAKFFSNFSIPDPDYPNDESKRKVIEFEKYSWDALFDTKVTAVEMLKLYTESIESMEKNPNIPQLFRDIFKNAYLPYRDPETLKLFLKTIGEFEYTHSEKLGDAFEYLLSVMGSQGDAGQFRTPRHIIDFLVEVVNPGKTDTILDPACGTAGFLISAFKHIKSHSELGSDHSELGSGHSELGSGHSELGSESKMLKQVQHDSLKQVQHDSLKQVQHGNLKQVQHGNLKQVQGEGLTPDEQKRLIQNFVGYDISPDMVRLSLVNLYLHGFSDPHIWEYDTLSSEERWNESFDVILANPPFMSPKGGIRPHKKFTIKSNRSEVLFVDYIAEHLNPKGKAGIIVPEGVIFQSGKAYKDLRKMLVENYLYAVVSLPAGVFNPYSGVKTSILLMDKELAKTKNEILFVKIDNDGYNLGAQRTAIKGGQLQEAIEVINKFKNQQSSHSELGSGHSELGSGHSELGSESPKSITKPTKEQTLKQVQGDYGSIAHAVLKFEIGKNGEYNLSGNRYVDTFASLNSNFPFIAINEICEFKRGTSITKKNVVDGEIPVIAGGQKPAYYHNEKNREAGSITISSSGAYAGFVSYHDYPIFASDCFTINSKHSQKLNDRFLFHLLKAKQDEIYKLQEGMGQPHVYAKSFNKWKIPLPPLSIQEEIVSEIESYQKIIDGAKLVVENYKPKIDIDPEWEMVELGEIVKLIGGGTPSRKIDEYWENGNIDWVSCSDFTSNSKYLPDSIRKITKAGLEDSSSNLIEKETLILVTRVSLGKLAFTSKPTAINQDLTALHFISDNIDKFFAYYYLLSISNKIEQDGNGITVKGVNREYVKRIKIPLPKIEIQKKIVSKIEKEQELVNANKQLIKIFEQKIKDRIAKVWGTSTTLSTGEYKKAEQEELNMAAEPETKYKKN